MRLRGNKGQVLVIVLGLILLMYVLTIFIVETGHFVTTKIHLQNSADAAAMESGIWYARNLNIASVINKIRFVTSLFQNLFLDLIDFVIDEAWDHIIDEVCPIKLICDMAKNILEDLVVPFVIDAIYVALDLEPLMELDQAVSKVQNQFTMVVPLVLVVQNAIKSNLVSGLREGIICIPCFSGVLPSLGIFTDLQRMIYIKVEYRYYDTSAKAMKTATQSEVVFDPKANKWKLRRSPYYYTDRVVVPDASTGIQRIIEGKIAARLAKKAMSDLAEDAAKDKELSKQIAKTMALQYTYIEETGLQEIYVVCHKKYKPIVATNFWPERSLFAVSMVRIEGGSMSIFDLGDSSGGGAQYAPKLQNIGAKEKAEAIQNVMEFVNTNLKKYVGTGMDLSGVNQFLDGVKRINH